MGHPIFDTGTHLFKHGENDRGELSAGTVLGCSNNGIANVFIRAMGGSEIYVEQRDAFRTRPGDLDMEIRG